MNCKLHTSPRRPCRLYLGAATIARHAELVPVAVHAPVRVEPLHRCAVCGAANCRACDMPAPARGMRWPTVGEWIVGAIAGAVAGLIAAL